ncbi:MAG: CAP domain-containing protein [Taibaiella sp.]|jgi:uncharacterized protein YkwD
MYIKFKPLVLLMVPILLLASSVSAFASSMEREILRYTNEFRQSKGKSILIMENTINAQAEKHSMNMARGKTSFGHQGFKDRVNAIKSKAGFISAAAENVAYGNMSAKEVVQGWINSPTHRKNLLGDFTHIGIGVAGNKNGRLYFTQLFIKK